MHIIIKPVLYWDNPTDLSKQTSNQCIMYCYSDDLFDIIYSLNINKYI